ncbi:hypothetical protein [Natronomonas sp.]|uniref:hypothetical protein n=1 Tax=Natronomonas sp. TaxID=2184060 RepID=UPI003976146F
MTSEEFKEAWGIDRRTVLKSAGAASGAALIGVSFSGVAAAKGGGKPCHKAFECTEGDAYVKFEFVTETDEDGNITDCYFEEETDTGLVEITDWDSKDGEECEPVSVEWEADGYVATTVMAFGGGDCDTVDDPGTVYMSGLENNGGNTAAISNLQFCLEETPFPDCPMYGTSRVGGEEGKVDIWSIRDDADEGELVEAVVGDIPDNSSDANYPNGLAFDPATEVWYFAEKGGLLKTMNEDGCLGIKVYNGISGGGDIAGATVYDGAYYFTPQGGDALFKVELNSDGSVVEDSGSVTAENVRTLPITGNTFGDIAADDNGVLYFSVNGAFFKVDLADSANDEVIVSGESDRDSYAVLSQLAFDDTETLWAHDASDGEWRTVDPATGEVSDVVATTKQYTDLATCGTFELNENCEEEA